MKIDSILAPTLSQPPPSESPPGTQSPAGIASDFEALLIGQMLRSARADSHGWFGTGEDTSSASLIEMAEDQIAKVIAQGGGLGLAGLIVR